MPRPPGGIDPGQYQDSIHSVGCRNPWGLDNLVHVVRGWRKHLQAAARAICQWWTVDPEILHSPGEETLLGEIRNQHGFAVVGEALAEYCQGCRRDRQVVHCNHE